MLLHIKFKCSFQFLFKLPTKSAALPTIPFSLWFFRFSSLFIVFWSSYFTDFSVALSLSLSLNMLSLSFLFILFKTGIGGLIFFYSIFLVFLNVFFSFFVFFFTKFSINFSFGLFVGSIFIADMGEFKANHNRNPCRITGSIGRRFGDTNTNKYSTHNNFLLFRLKFRLVLCS